MNLTPERWRSIEDLYHAAMEKPPAERAGFLETSTTDEELRREVASMLGSAPSALMQRSPWSKPKSLGPYQVGEEIGAGGMGEVYKGRDTRLGRDVALKVLPAGMTGDPDRRARFIREAQSTSRLNHPNIVTVYDVGESEGRVYIAMEYVAGKTLAELIPRTGLRFASTLAYAIPVAAALAKAHSEGIIHRDVKPGNIMVTAEGTVKVLDFGLAKLLQAPPAFESAPLAAKSETQPGVLMGTPAFMSPEQAEGKPLDARSDIFSFGAVLYEMGTGQRAFRGDSMAATMAAVLHKTPVMPAEVPTGLQTVIQRCLRKDPERRFQSMADLRVALLDLQETGEEPAPTPQTPMRRMFWMTALGVVALALAAIATAHFREESPAASAMNLTLPLPNTVATVSYLELSPDGRTLLLGVTDKDAARSGLVLRSLDSDQIRLLPGTTLGRDPFWSPDGKRIAYSQSDGKLQIMSAGGGPTEAVFESFGCGCGGATWGAGGVILALDVNSQFERCDAGRSSCRALAEDSTLKRTSPVFLPDGKHFLFGVQLAGPESASRAGVYVGSLEDPNGKRLLPDASKALYSQGPGGHGFLLFRRDEALVAQAFDLKALTLSGDVFKIAEDVSRDDNAQMMASVASNGVLVYETGRNVNTQLTWLDRAGKVLSVAGPVRPQHSVALSPHGNQILVTRGPLGTIYQGLWLRDAARDSESRLVAPPLSGAAGVWSSDGRMVAFAGKDDNLYRKDVSSGAREELILKDGNKKNTSDWSRDGRYLLFTVTDPKTKGDIWVLPDPGGIAGASKPYPFQRTDAVESQAQFSPDGKWIAYTSNESGSEEVYVRPFPSGPGRWKVSAGSGFEPRWRSDGKELFYWTRGSAPLSRMMALPVKAGANGSFAAGEPQPLFEQRIYKWTAGFNFSTYRPAPDGQRFLVLAKPVEQETIHVLYNWTQMVRGKL